MKATLRLPHAATYADYLAVEQSSEHRHELIDGVIVAMAGGSDEHNAIGGKLAGLLVNRVTAGCRYYTNDQRFWIPAHGRGRHSNGSIICGKPEHPAHDAQATINPVIVMEVLSPSSEGDDDFEKRRDFQSLETLRAYVLCDQDRRRVRVYRRGESGEWQSRASAYGPGESFELPCLSSPVPVDDVYEGILDENGRSLLK